MTDNLIRVEAKLSGHPANAVLDSGTGSILVDRSFANRVGLKQEKTPEYALGGGGTLPIIPVSIDSVQFGPVDLHHISGVSMDTGHFSRMVDFPIDVVLGYQIFLAQALTIDYPRHRIDFRPAHVEAKCTNPVALTFFHGVPIVAATVRPMTAGPAATVHMIVDLGTRHYAAMLGGPFLQTAAGQALMHSGKPRQVGTGIGGAFDGVESHVRELRVGEFYSENVTVALTTKVASFAAGVADGALGVPLWKGGTITFDYPHRRLCLGSGP